jgi:hypothetical protein
MKLFRRRSKGEETPPRKRSVRRRVGSAIIFALTVLTPVLLASGTVLSQLRAYSDEVDRRVNGVTAQMVAATGAHDALSRLALDLNYRGTLQVAIDGGRSTVDVTQIAGELTLDVADDLMQVRSEGWLNGPADGTTNLPRDGVRWYRSVVNTVVKPHLVKVPMEQTVTLANPNARVFFSGTNFRVMGEDAAADPVNALPGIGVAGDPAALTAQIPSTLQQYVTGAAADTTASVRQTMPIDVSSWLERYHANPDFLWTAPTQRLGTCQLGDDANPAVSFAEGDVLVRGNVVGRGVLAVRGDLRVIGSLDFKGVILVGGSVSLTPTAPTRLKGATLVGGNPMMRDLDIAGDVQIQYDSAALEQFVGHFIDGVEVVTWDHDLDAGLPAGS